MVFPILGKTEVAMKLAEPVSVGDKLTFDGWQEGLAYEVKDLVQSHKHVTTAVPGLASVTADTYVATGSNVYKITDDKPAQPPAGSATSATAAQNAPKTGATATAAFGAVGAAIGLANRLQNQNAAVSGNQSYQKKVEAVAEQQFSENGSGGRLGLLGQVSQYSANTMQLNLKATNTEFLQYAPEYAVQAKAKSMGHLFWYMIVAVVLILPMVALSMIYPNSNIPIPILLVTLFAELLISGCILLYIGFKEFSLKQRLSSTPEVKIDVATYNLNKMQGKFIPHNANALKAPISGANCTYYSEIVFVVFKQSNGNTTNYQVTPLGTMGLGVPTLFTDGSGYLAVDMGKAPNVEVISNAFRIEKEGLASKAGRFLPGGEVVYFKEGKDLANELLPKLTEAANKNSTIDLSQIPGFKFNQIFSNKARDIKSRLGNYEFRLSTFENFAFFLMEQYTPVNSDYTCIGAAADINKNIEGKPVKVLVPDQQSGIMAVKVGNEQKATSGMSKRTLINIAAGILFIIAAFYLLSVYSNVTAAAPAGSAASLATTTVLQSQPPSGYGTTIPPSTSVSQPGSSLAAKAGCNGFNVSVSGSKSEKSAECDWTGGNVTIFAGTGISGFMRAIIVGANGKTYLDNGTTDWCPTQIAKIYLPPQDYNITIKSGAGGGSCSSSPNAVVSISAS